MSSGWRWRCSTPRREHLLGARGRAYVEQQYTWHRVEAVYRGVIDRLAARPV